MEALHRLGRIVSLHRRVLAAVLAGLATFVVVNQLTPRRQDLTKVPVITTAIPAGHTIVEAEVRLAALPDEALPEAPSVHLEEVIGQTTAVSLSPGTVLQPGLFTSADTAEPGRSLTPIQLSEPSLKSLLTPGMRVSLVMTESSEVITPDARISALPAEPERSGLQAGGASRPLIVVDVPTEVAATVSSLGQGGGLSVILGSAG